MSDYHILSKAVNNKTCQIAVHLAIPDENNLAGISYRTALIERLGEIVSIIPNHAITFPDDDEALKAGELYEKIIMKRFSSIELTNIQRRQEIRAEISQMKTDIEVVESELYNEIIEPLAWWGYHEEVA